MSTAPTPDAAAACRLRLEPLPPSHHHAEQRAWRANVGEPVAVDCADRAADRLHGLDVLSWNVAIGRGRLDRVLDHLRRGSFGGAAMSPERPLVILLQEAYRADPSVPAAPGSAHHGGHAPGRPDRLDVVQLARDHRLSLRYSPSMRNGSHPSDRGNAILATAALAGAEALLLPWVRQRRVAVAARLAGHANLTFVSAHLDTHGQPGERRRVPRFGGGRAGQAAALAALLAEETQSLVMGADLNSVLGMTDPAVRELVAAGMHPARRVGSWRHTLHSPLRLLLDHVLYRCGRNLIAGAQVLRLDEAPGDRSPGVFGSDHHPLLARITLHPAPT
jgi:endonuclease/exonuclease/phosphatase family metal-dependent hydrolase